jgi:nucleoside-diphosphate-sugar epimerase
MVTVLGASGFVGSHLVIKLKSLGIEFYVPQRNDNLCDKELGDVIYCIGMTADFRQKPFETVDAHVCKLSEVLRNCKFESLTYLSSTRVYFGTQYSKDSIKEDDDVVLNIKNPNDLFAATKIAGEFLALNCGKKNIKIVRLSNVFGDDFASENFITSIVKDALLNKKIELRTTSDSAKDYIAVDDVCESLLLLSKYETTGVFNLSSGINVSNGEILSKLKLLTETEIIYSNNAERIVFPLIDNSKLVSTIGFKPGASVIEYLPRIVENFKMQLFL